MTNDKEIYQDIPTWDNGTWTSTDFDSREDFAKYVRDLFKEPGQYAFDDVSYEFNAEATKFNEQGFYCAAPFKSRDFINYWEGEKKKCRKGVIYKSGDKTWYIARDYYMWLNFIPIFNKSSYSFNCSSPMLC